MQLPLALARVAHVRVHCATLRGKRGLAVPDHGVLTATPPLVTNQENQEMLLSYGSAHRTHQQPCRGHRPEMQKRIGIPLASLQQTETTLRSEWTSQVMLTQKHAR